MEASRQQPGSQANAWCPPPLLAGLAVGLGFGALAEVAKKTLRPEEASGELGPGLRWQGGPWGCSVGLLGSPRVPPLGARAPRALGKRHSWGRLRPGGCCAPVLAPPGPTLPSRALQWLVHLHAPSGAQVPALPLLPPLPELLGPVSRAGQVPGPTCTHAVGVSGPLGEPPRGPPSSDTPLSCPRRSGC